MYLCIYVSVICHLSNLSLCLPIYLCIYLLSAYLLAYHLSIYLSSIYLLIYHYHRHLSLSPYHLASYLSIYLSYRFQYLHLYFHSLVYVFCFYDVIFFLFLKISLVTKKKDNFMWLVVPGISYLERGIFQESPIFLLYFLSSHCFWNWFIWLLWVLYHT
jgi:hypothetical protein